MQHGALFVLAIINAKCTYQDDCIWTDLFAVICDAGAQYEVLYIDPKYFHIYSTCHAGRVRNMDNLSFL